MFSVVKDVPLDDNEHSVSQLVQSSSTIEPGSAQYEEEEEEEEEPSNSAAAALISVQVCHHAASRRVHLVHASLAELLQCSLPAVNAIRLASGLAALDPHHSSRIVVTHRGPGGRTDLINSDQAFVEALRAAKERRRVLKLFVDRQEVDQSDVKVPVELPTLMRAILYRQHGPPEKVLQVVAEWTVPKITKPTEVLVRVHAAAINPIDCKMMHGDLALLRLPFPSIPGFDVSGIVMQTGLYCSRIKAGDAVFGLASFKRCGTFAEYVVMNEDEVALKPFNLTHVEAASLPLVSVAAHKALVSSAQLQRQQKILILGGSGGVGTIAVQLAKFLGGYVVCTTSRANMDLCKELGADEVIDYTNPGTRWWDVLRGQDYDVIFDTVGGVDSWEQSSLVLKKKVGKFVTIAGDSQESAKWTFSGLLSRGASIANRKFWSLFGGNKYDYVISAVSSFTILDSIRELVQTRAVRPVIDSVYALEDAIKVFTHSMSGRSRGKVVISIIPEQSDEKYPHGSTVALRGSQVEKELIRERAELDQLQFQEQIQAHSSSNAGWLGLPDRVDQQ